MTADGTTGGPFAGSTDRPAPQPPGPWRRGLRGWGGVGAMAAACALALAATLTLTCGFGGPTAVPGTADPAARARQASTSSCDAQNMAQSLPPSQATGPAVRRIQQRHELIVGVDQSSYLWGYRDSTSGQLEGFDIDLVQAIADNLLGPHPHIVYRAIPTADRFTDIDNGSVDMVVRTVSIACSRMSVAAFSTAYFEAGQQMVVARDNTTITGYDSSIRGKRVCVADNSSAQQLLGQQSYGARQVTVQNQLDCLVQLQLGYADAVFTDNALGAGLAAQDPSVHLVGHAVNPEPYGVAMNPKDTDLVRRVNAVLQTYRQGGWQRSYQHWLAKDLPGISGPPPAQYKS
ncbi:glutamate ABC transporter substrate-binding protein [Streptomyces sp. SL13]|uniref:Glutamate ABC transporter substrate-binding protein n=1 Tax=Streptantibioticus silvisoli TaxID=2705255 RepID=A0AA90KBR9_9ACTN|nr:glutamate ABC transporter substrate-binding protein [Streptantibioticus silvisoli]MDI5973692.1 glutamate ABC transporter substrate-binding protein [Streptantibioticus silvisoli]